MSASEPGEDRIGSLTPEERRRVFEEESRHVNAKGQVPPPTSPSTPGRLTTVIDTTPNVRMSRTVVSIGVALLIGIAALLYYTFQGAGVVTPNQTSASTPHTTATAQREQSDAALAPPAWSVEDMTLSAMQEHNDVLAVKTDFVEPSRPMSLRVEGTAYTVDHRDGMMYYFKNVSIPKIGINQAKLILETGGVDLAPLTLEFQIAREMRTIDEWRKYAEPIDYKRLLKGADPYAGKLVKGRGKIYQIVERNGMTEGGINVTPMGYGIWDDNLRFSMSETTEFVQDDVVSFYGEIVGDYSYETTAGWNVTVPMIRVEKMER
jgi:hypothetical protein